MAGLIGVTLDHYQLLEQVGMGGMATVYRALDTRTQNSVAVKVLSPTISGDRKFVRRFRREGALVSRLKHAHIVPVIDYGEFRGLVYLVMPFVEGETLHARMARGGPSEALASRWIHQVASALAFAHAHGVLHRDVKPSNVIIDPGGDAHLTDFGLARMIEGSNTLTGSALLGTPAYMSPEQAKGEALDPRSDQYSLGVILYELSTGRLPFEADTPMATALMHLQVSVPSPRAFNPKLGPAVEKVILTALAKDRQVRFKDVTLMDEAYKAALSGDPLSWLHASTTPVGRPTSPSLPRGRRKAWLVAGAALPALLLGLFFYRPAVAAWLRSALAEGAGAGAAPGTAAVGRDGTSVPGGGETAAATPSAVPTAASTACPGITLFGYVRAANEVHWTVLNATGAPVQMVGIRPTYPASNVPVQIELGGQSVWSVGADATLEPDGSYHIDEGATIVNAGQAKEILIRYTWPPDENRYSLEVTFDVGCSLAANW